MRTLGWIFLGALAASLPLACGNDNAADPTGAGVGGSTGVSAPTGSGGGGGGEACGPSCTIQCDASASLPSLGDCVNLGGPIECNPLTNEKCDLTSAEACDLAAGGFRCFQAPNDRQLCETCSPSGPHCAPGLTCTADGVCAKFCCNDDDCGSSGKCDTIENLGVGICLKGAGGPGGGGPGGPGGGGPGGGGPGGGGPGGGGPGGGGPGGGGVGGGVGGGGVGGGVGGAGGA